MKKTLFGRVLVVVGVWNRVQGIYVFAAASAKETLSRLHISGADAVVRTLAGGGEEAL